MTSFYVFSALAAQREDEIERAAIRAERERVRRQAGREPEPPSHHRLGWHRRRHLRLV
jgi:hypothetical protein